MNARSVSLRQTEMLENVQYQNHNMIATVSKNTIFDMYARIAHAFYIRISNDGDQLENSHNASYKQNANIKQCSDEQLMRICAFQVQNVCKRVKQRLIQEDNQYLLDQQLKILIEECNKTEFQNNVSIDNHIIQDNESILTEQSLEQQANLQQITHANQKQNDTKIYLNYFKGPSKPNEYDQIKDKHLLQFLYPKTLISAQNRHSQQETLKRNQKIYECATKKISHESTMESTQQMALTNRKNPVIFTLLKKASIHPTNTVTKQRKTHNKIEESTVNAKESNSLFLNCDQISLRQSKLYKNKIVPEANKKVLISKDKKSSKKLSFMKNKSQQKRVGDHLTLFNRMNEIQRKIMNKVPILSKMGVKFAKLA